MKKVIFILLSAVLFAFASCEKDNYDEPKSEITGKLITTKGTDIGVKSTNGAVKLQLFQQEGAFTGTTAMEVFVDQKGEFKAKVFNGNYKLITADNNGPWVNHRDTLVVNVKGGTTIEYEVEPYYLLKNESFKVEGNILTVNFDIEKVAEPGRDIENVTLYINSTLFVDDGANIGDKGKINVESPKVGTNQVSVDLTDLGSKYHDLLYARVGLKISGVEQRLYTTGSVQIR